MSSNKRPRFEKLSQPVSFWLVPEGDDAKELNSLIESLRRERRTGDWSGGDAPSFKAHLTLHYYEPKESSAVSEEDLRGSMTAFANRVVTGHSKNKRKGGDGASLPHRLELIVRSVKESPVYFKTLYLEFIPASSVPPSSSSPTSTKRTVVEGDADDDYALLLSAREAMVREGPVDLSGTDYVFLPHVSLMYSRSLNRKDRDALIKELSESWVGRRIAFGSVCASYPAPGKQDFYEVEGWVEGEAVEFAGVIGAGDASSSSSSPGGR